MNFLDSIDEHPTFDASTPDPLFFASFDLLMPPYNPSPFFHLTNVVIFLQFYRHFSIFYHMNHTFERLQEKKTNRLFA